MGQAKQSAAGHVKSAAINQRPAARSKIFWKVFPQGQCSDAVVQEGGVKMHIKLAAELCSMGECPTQCWF